MAFTRFNFKMLRDGSAQRKSPECRKRKCAFTTIPDALSFDMIINGGTCSPCTVRDFMDHLLYVERAAENLQFFLWYKDYTRRFNQLPEAQNVLSPEWSNSQRSCTRSNKMPSPSLKLGTPDDVPLVDASSSPTTRRDIEYCPSSSPNTPLSAAFDEKVDSLRSSPSIACCGTEIQDKTDGADFKKSRILTCTHSNSAQPFRQETSRILATYIIDGSPRQLNLTADERETLLQASDATTHPSAFKQVADTVEWHLRQQSHPNFVKWAMSNSNRYRYIMARIMSVSGVIAGLVAGIVPILSGANRAWRALCAVVLFPMVAIAIIAWSGSCFLLLCGHRRQLYPWEFFTDLHDDPTPDKTPINGKALYIISETNSYEDAPWVPKYEQRNIFQRIFGPETQIEDPALRRLHTILLIRSLVLSAIITAIIIGVLVAIPKGDFF